MGKWGLLSNHALVLIHVIEHPRSTLRQIADAVGVTDRAALSLIRALEEDAIVQRRREGRQNVYTVDVAALMRHRSQGRYSIGEIAAALLAIAGEAPQIRLPEGMQIIGSVAGALGEMQG